MEVIVRSSGAEDGDDGVVNAGGNESILVGVPTPHSLFDSISKVVQSYFSEKSISQRLNSGDKTLREPNQKFLFCSGISWRSTLY